jgi:hypothetical protein
MHKCIEITCSSSLNPSIPSIAVYGPRGQIPIHCKQHSVQGEYNTFTCIDCERSTFAREFGLPGDVIASYCKDCASGYPESILISSLPPYASSLPPSSSIHAASLPTSKNIAYSDNSIEKTTEHTNVSHTKDTFTHATESIPSLSIANSNLRHSIPFNQPNHTLKSISNYSIVIRNPENAPAKRASTTPVSRPTTSQSNTVSQPTTSRAPPTSNTTSQPNITNEPKTSQSNITNEPKTSNTTNNIKTSNTTNIKTKSIELIDLAESDDEQPMITTTHLIAFHLNEIPQEQRKTFMNSCERESNQKPNTFSIYNRVRDHLLKEHEGFSPFLQRRMCNRDVLELLKTPSQFSGAKTVHLNLKTCADSLRRGILPSVCLDAFVRSLDVEKGPVGKNPFGKNPFANNLETSSFEEQVEHIPPKQPLPHNVPIFPKTTYTIASHLNSTRGEMVGSNMNHVVRPRLGGFDVGSKPLENMSFGEKSKPLESVEKTTPVDKSEPLKPVEKTTLAENPSPNLVKKTPTQTPPSPTNPPETPPKRTEKGLLDAFGFWPFRKTEDLRPADYEFVEEKERLEKETLDKERLEKERLEHERLEKQKEKERLEKQMEEKRKEEKGLEKKKEETRLEKERWANDEGLAELVNGKKKSGSTPSPLSSTSLNGTTENDTVTQRTGLNIPGFDSDEETTESPIAMLERDVFLGEEDLEWQKQHVPMNSRDILSSVLQRAETLTTKRKREITVKPPRKKQRTVESTDFPTLLQGDFFPRAFRDEQMERHAELMRRLERRNAAVAGLTSVDEFLRKAMVNRAVIAEELAKRDAEFLEQQALVDSCWATFLAGTLNK